MTVVAITGRGDLDDVRWLAAQVATLGDGIEAARAIWENWSDLRNVGRLHPGMSPGEYIASLGLRLTAAEAFVALPEATDSERARVAGVDRTTALRARQGVQNAQPDEPLARVIGADGKSYPGRVVREVTAEVIEPEGGLIEEEGRTEPAYWADLTRIAELIEALFANTDAPTVAATVPSRRRAATARRLRKLGTYLGGIAWSLERNGDPS